MYLRDAMSNMGRAGLGWLGINMRPAMATLDASDKVSWQDVHCIDTAWLIRRQLEPTIGSQPRTIPSIPGTALSAADLDWVRGNVALIYLLHAGQWQPVPSKPPIDWFERLASDCSRITAREARTILIAAFDAVPQPAKAMLLQPLSADERAWVRQNSTTVRDLCSGQLRGIPTTASRAWIAALQSAVGGTASEIAAILGIILDLIAHTSSAMGSCLSSIAGGRT